MFESIINQNISENNITLKKVLIFFATVISFLVFLENLDDPVLWPQNNLKLDSVCAIEGAPKGSVIIDKKYNRLLFLNKDREVIKVILLGNADSPCDEVYYSEIIDDRVFIAGGRLIKDGFYFTSELVLEYDLDGNFINKCFQYNFKDDEYIAFPTINKIHLAKDGALQITTLRNNKFIILEVNDNKTEYLQLIEAPETLRRSYELTAENFTLINGLSGKWYLFTHSVDGLLNIPEAKAKQLCLEHYNLTEKQSMLLFDRGIFPSANMLTGFKDLEDNEKHISHINYDWELEDFSFDTNTNKTIRSLPLSFSLYCKTIFFWLSVLYLIIVFLFLLYKAVKYIKNNAMLPASHLKATLIMVLLAAIITGFYTKATYDYLEKDCRKTIKEHLIQSYYIMKMFYPNAAAIEKSSRDWYEEHPQRISLQKHLQEFIQAGGKDESYYVEVLFWNKSNQAFYTLADSSGWNTAGTISRDLTRNVTTKDENTLYISHTQGGIYLQCYKYLRNENGQIIAAIDSGCLLSNLLANARHQAITNFFNLLAILIGLYLTWLCFNNFSQDLSIFRKLNAEKVPGAKSHLTGITSFLTSIAYMIDSIIGVFVIKEILQTSSLSELAFYASLPTLCYASGSFLFTLFFVKKVLQSFSERKVAIAGTLSCIIVFLLMLLSVQLHNIFLFLFAKVLAGIFVSGILYNIIALFPLSAEENDRRVDAFYEHQRFQQVATIATVLGGVYLAEEFGFGWIYLLPVISYILLLPLFWYSCSKTPALESTAKSPDISSLKKSSSFFLSGRGLIFSLCIFLPYTIGACYNQYMFPLICSSSAVSPITLTNLSVFSMVCTVSLNDIVKKYKKRFSARTVNIFNIIFWSLLLLCFTISNSIKWTVAVLFIIMVVCSKPDIMSYLLKQADESGFSVKQTNIESGIVSNVLQIIRNAIFSAMALLFSIYTTTYLLGLFCLILICFYALYSLKYNSTKISPPI